MSARERQAARTVQPAAGPARGPVWRALLEAQWRARLQEVTELSLAYHEAAAVLAAAPADRKDHGQAGRGSAGRGRPDPRGDRQAGRGSAGRGRPDPRGDGQAGRGSAGRGLPGDDGPSANEPSADESGDRKLRQLLRRAVAARRALADTDEALGRLASGRYGLCEGCAAAIPAWLLTVTPDTRYCPRCRPRPIRATRAAPALAAVPRWRAAPH